MAKVKRPQAPVDCPFYKAMLNHTDDKKTASGLDGKEIMIHTGVTMGKLESSNSDLCKAYAADLKAFRKALDG